MRLDRGWAVAQVALGVERAHAAGAGGGDCLAVGVVDDVADGEDPGQVGPGRARLGDDVAVLVGVDLALTTISDLGMWPIATKAPSVSISSSAPVSALRRRTFASLPSSPATNSSGMNGVFSSMFSFSRRAVEHDLRGAELVAAVDDRQSLRRTWR